MRLSKSQKQWSCPECGYKLDDNLFRSGVVFWFCDQCDSYLNSQDGFNPFSKTHICTNCGFKNKTTEDNIIDVCSACGKKLTDGEKRLCKECSADRRRKRVKIAGAAIGTAAVVIAASDNSNHKENRNVERIPSFEKVTRSWLDSASEDELREVDDELVAYLDAHDWDSSKKCNIAYRKHNDIVNAIASRFPLNLPKREHGWHLENDD